MKNEQTIGERIKHCRLQAGLSQQGLADALHYKSGTAISLIESNARGVDVSDLPKFAKALGVNVSILLGEEEAPNFAVALRADKALSAREKEQVLDFYNYVKSRKG